MEDAVMKLQQQFEDSISKNNTITKMVQRNTATPIFSIFERLCHVHNFCRIVV
ncbi:hypothetical protein Sjap_020365 [Stephania japonica]|uniref:Uncharacterized protein n=1 Tax=Stephania japonica TaxID=461633 RepID=A0AAP0I079_9MAGN